MKYSSRAISLTYIKQGESTIISNIFTEERGLQTFFIKGVRSKKSKIKLAYFEPLKLISIDASFIAKKPLQNLQGASVIEPFNLGRKNIYKNFISFFIAEVTTKVLQKNEKNTTLFNFVWQTINSLYGSEKTDPNFALKYLLNLSHFLGFYPSLDNLNKPFFNLLNGCFSNTIDLEESSLEQEKSNYLKALLKNSEVIIPQKQKQQLLTKLLQYYKIHHYNLDGVTSHLVIETLRK